MSSTILGRVLVVDDELQLMDALVEALTAQGYEAHGFNTGIAAIEALQLQEFDLLLTDLMMPGMDGITLLKACMAIDSNLVGIIMTGQGTVSTAVDAMKSGAFDYVLKPFRLDAVIPVLARAREMQRLRLENIQLREMVAIHNLSQTIAVSLDANVVLETTADAALQQTGADEVSIMLLRPESNELYISVVRGRDREYLVGQNVSMQESIAGWVAYHLEPLILNGEIADPRFSPIRPRPEIFSAVSIPMMTAGKLIGVLNVNNLQARRSFTAGQVKSLSILTTAAAAALENEALYTALNAREKRFRALIENAPDGIALLGLDGKLRQVTPSTEHILGYTLDEAIGQDPALLTHPDDLPNLLVLLNDLIQNPGKVAPTQYRFMHKDGSWRWLESTVSNLLAEPGIQAVVFNYRDITERKQAEEKLRRSDQILERVNALVLVADREGKVVYISPAAKSILGYEPDELLGEKWWKVRRLEPTEAQREKEYVGRAARGEVSITAEPYERALQDRFGNIHWISWVDAAGPGDTLIGIGHDFTERKQAEEAVRQSEEQYRSLFEDSPISLWVEDFSEAKQRLEQLKENGVEDIATYLHNHPDFVIECASHVRILDVNGAAMKLYHAKDKAELLGSVKDILPSLSVQQFEDELIQLINGQFNFEREGIDHTLTNEEIHVNARWSVVPRYETSLAKVIISTVNITDRKRAEEQTQLQLERLKALRAIDVAISSSFDLRLTLDILLDYVTAQLKTDAAAILLFHPIIKTLEYAASRGFRSKAIRKSRVRLGEGYAGQSILERRIIHIPNLMEVNSAPEQSSMITTENFIEYYCAPLIVKGEVKGVLEIYHRSPRADRADWVDFLETLAGQAAIAIENASLFEDLQHSNIELFQAYDATIEGWSHALDLRDKETEGHSLRVTEMTLKLAGKFDFTEDQLRHIRWGALLHDIGKMGIPDKILLKPDKLTDEEWERMKQHPVFALEMLSPIAYLKSALDIPYCHHEKWDGTGYPRGLNGEVIPLAARLFAIVDVWDALRSDRPYRKAWSLEKTVEHIRSLSGTHFDPRVVEYFIDMIERAN